MKTTAYTQYRQVLREQWARPAGERWRKDFLQRSPERAQYYMRWLGLMSDWCMAHNFGHPVGACGWWPKKSMYRYAP